MGRLSRLLRHRWLDEHDTLRLIGADALARIESRIRASELQHSGEIRVCIESSLPLAELWRDVSSRERALALFGALRVWDTEANNGVLIYLLLADHAIEIVADRGVARHVDPSHWHDIVEQLRDDLRAGRHEAGLLRAVDAVHAVLLAHYPLAPGETSPNELPDAVALR